jgi:hypothetical protein
VAPTATFNAPSSVNEGSAIGLSLTSPVDVAADLPGLEYAFDCGDGAGYGAFSSSNSRSCPTTDNGLRPIKGKIKDKDDGVSEYTASVTIVNVAPTVTAVTPSANVLIGQPLTFTGTATDPSSADTTAGFSWAWNTGSGFGPFGAVNNNTYVTTYSACGTYTVQAQARDKDGGISQAFTSSPVSVWSGNFLPPLKEGMANVVQKGRVVPVQISFGCGGHRSGLAPEIQLLAGDFVANAGTETSAENVVTQSVSNADMGNVMREIDSKYHYNLAIPNYPSWSGGQALTVRVRPFGPNTSPTMYILLEIKK